MTRTNETTIRAAIDAALRLKTDEAVGAMIQEGRKNPPVNVQMLRSLKKSDQHLIGVLINAYWDRGIKKRGWEIAK